MKKFLIAIAATCAMSTAQAQDFKKIGTWMKDNKVFQNLDLSVTAGTTGIGIDVEHTCPWPKCSTFLRMYRLSSPHYNIDLKDLHHCHSCT